jgi:hypothetical protein
MLASITPLGERGRQSHWSITATAFVLAAVAAGVLIGALAGAAGAPLLDGLAGTRTRLLALGVAALAAIALEITPRALPGPSRQVDERWLDQFRGWVYGLGYGGQLGLGVATIVSSASTYLALVAAVLVAEPGRGALVMGCFGLVRGLSLLAGAYVQTPHQLFLLHRRLERGRPLARVAGLLVMAGIAAGALS